MQELSLQVNKAPYATYDLFSTIKSDIQRLLETQKVVHLAVCDERDALRMELGRVDREVEDLNRQVSELKKDKDEALTALQEQKAKSNSRSDAIPPPLAHLQSQYADLLAAKRTISAKYRTDIRRWKAFKEELVRTGAFKPTLCDACKKPLGKERKAKSRVAKAWEDVGLGKGFGIDADGQGADVDVGEAGTDAGGGPQR